MKSIKPGRGPSMMGGIVGIIMICIGVVWTVIAFNAFPPLGLFGICWTCIAVVTTVYNFKNATGENRYSQFDIVDSDEESDPLNDKYGKKTTESKDGNSKSYCPYCGNKVQNDHKFCNNCGNKL